MIYIITVLSRSTTLFVLVRILVYLYIIIRDVSGYLLFNAQLSLNLDRAYNMKLYVHKYFKPIICILCSTPSLRSAPGTHCIINNKSLPNCTTLDS